MIKESTRMAERGHQLRNTGLLLFSQDKIPNHFPTISWPELQFSQLMRLYSLSIAITIAYKTATQNKEKHLE